MESAINYDASDDINVESEIACRTEATIPANLRDLAKTFNSVPAFVNHVNGQILKDSEIQIIEELTRGQAEVPLWHAQRQGRITGSKVHDVVTRMRTVKRDGNTDVTNLIKRVMGYNPPDPSLPALKYGRLQEPIAVDSYMTLRRQECPDATFKEAGLFVSQAVHILGASPDGIVTCSCHGPGALEIKCPFSIVGETPSPLNVQYLEEHADGHYRLKKTHKYYTQVQMQLGCTQNIEYCDFFVFTGHSSTAHCERIEFDTKLWAEICEATRFFFSNYLAHELVNPQLEGGHVNKEMITPKVVPQPVHVQQKKDHKQKQGKSKRQKLRPTYICPVCDETCKDSEDFEDTAENSVGCDQCRQWFHWGCVGFDEEEEDNEEWICNDCT